MTEGHGDDIYRYPETRLNFSSNIYAGADMTALKEHLCRHIDLVDNYPEPTPRSLEAAIARKHGVGSDNVLVTAGATEAIYLIAQTFSMQGRSFTASILHPTFSEYEDACRMYGIPLVTPLGQRTLATCGTQERPSPIARHHILWLCNPNNPTGSVCPKAEIQELADRFEFVVVDQSYEDYTLEPMLTHQEAAASHNILQLHSLTKTYAIPGLRIGYVVAPSHVIALLRQHVRPWSVNSLAIEAGRWLVENNVSALPDLAAYLAETRRLRQRLNEIPGIEAADTHTNFILAQIHPQTAASLKDYLATSHAILIRDASNFRGLTPHHFRISTQSPPANNLLVDAIAAYSGNSR